MVFTEAEIAYLTEQRLGRLATRRADGTLQNSPVGFSYNDRLQTIDIGGHHMVASHKFRNVADNGQVAFVVDDIPSTDPWQVRCLEIRGTAEALGEPDAIIRIHPRRIISYGIGAPQTMRPDSRNVTV